MMASNTRNKFRSKLENGTVIWPLISTVDNPEIARPAASIAEKFRQTEPRACGA